MVYRSSSDVCSSREEENNGDNQPCELQFYRDHNSELRARDCPIKLLSGGCIPTCGLFAKRRTNKSKEAERRMLTRQSERGIGRPADNGPRGRLIIADPEERSAPWGPTSVCFIP